MINRRSFLVALVVLGGCGRNEEPTKAKGQAQPATTVRRIGWLGQGELPAAADRGVDDFQEALRDLGYVEGPSFIVEYRYGKGSGDQLSELASELVKLKVDVIVTSGELAALAAKRATKSIPIVATEFGIDPVKADVVVSLGRPGVNVTGLLTQDAELWQKRLDVFKKEMAPSVSRASVMWNPSNPGNVSSVEVIRAAAPALGLQITTQEVRDSDALERAFVAIAKERPDALVTCWDHVTLTHARRIAEVALMQGLPMLAPIREYVAAGSLMSLGINLPAHRRRAAYFVDKLLKGAKPDSLPVELPLGHDFVVNVATAKALSIELKPYLLTQADELIT